MALAAQFGLAVFEAIFALYAQSKFNCGPGQVGAVFVVCGLVMTVFQGGVVGMLGGRIRELHQIGVGFVLMGTSLSLLVVPSTRFWVLVLVGLLASGTALVSPNLASLISKRSGARGTGAALGAQNAANSMGASERAGSWWRALHLADKRAVFADRSNAGHGGGGCGTHRIGRPYGDCSDAIRHR